MTMATICLLGTTCIVISLVGSNHQPYTGAEVLLRYSVVEYLNPLGISLHMW